MYIAPNSTIELFKNLKLDNSYANTMWFTSYAWQNTFFSNHRYTQLNDYSYQRKDIGVIRVEGTVANLYDVNYMRFKNTSFEDKWFYAFVTRVEYINNATVNMYYTIDVIQTYMFDWTLNQCLVERQHSTTDVAGDNLIPEGLELGDYINSSVASIWTPSAAFDDYSYLICVGLSQSEYNDIINETRPAHHGDYSGEWVDESAYFQMVANQFTAIAYLKCDQGGDGNPIAIMDYLNANNLIDAIVAFLFIPKDFHLTNSGFSTPYTLNKPVAIDGYTPVNKKLLTYPYCYLDIYNDQNEHEELRFELFTGASCAFILSKIVSAAPEAILMPTAYNNANLTPETCLSVGGFPQIPYFNDAYKAWQALNYDQMAVSRQITAQEVAFTKQGIGISQKQLEKDTVLGVGGGIANTIANIASLNLGGAVNASLGAASSLYSGIYGTQKNELATTKAEYENYALKLRQSADESRARNLPNTSHAGSASANVSLRTKGFWYNIKSIRNQYAERIDKYFTMFGYAQNIVAVPNIHARQYFTYIKTTGSCVSGRIPQDDRETIDTIFDRGIRFWTNYDYFENYSVNNAIIT